MISARPQRSKGTASRVHSAGFGVSMVSLVLLGAMIWALFELPAGVLWYRYMQEAYFALQIVVMTSLLTSAIISQQEGVLDKQGVVVN